MIPEPSAADLAAAARALAGRVHRTPLESLSSVTTAERPLHLKCENLQKTGAFKARGALNAVLSCTPEQRARGLVTWSSGNHGAALAWAASQVGGRCTVFVPEDVSASKARAIRAYGAEVIPAGRTSADRYAAAQEAVARHGLFPVPPFDFAPIVAGQSTVGRELLEQAPALDRIYVPVGGGGLLAGIALAVEAAGAAVEVVAVEPVGAASLGAALAAGRPVPITLGETIADGLRPVEVGALPHQIAARTGVRAITVDDAALRAAMRVLFERAHLVVEPSGATGLAGWFAEPDLPGAAAVVLSGGNVDVARFVSLLA